MLAVSKSGKTPERLAEALFRAVAVESGFAYPADAWERMPEHRQDVWRGHAADRITEKLK
jgi:hypothetical protein